MEIVEKSNLTLAVGDAIVTKEANGKVIKSVKISKVWRPRGCPHVHVQVETDAHVACYDRCATTRVKA